MSGVLQAIVDESNNIVYDDLNDEEGRIYIYNRLNKTTGVMDDNDENRALLGISPEILPQTSQGDAEREELVVQGLPTINASNSQNHKMLWSHDRTLQLINCLKLQDFKSTIIKNDTVYSVIKNEINSEGGNVSTSQVKDKIKYLKMRYMKKKDNMKATSSGAASIQFMYFDEMDEIFGKKPNVEPVAIASSLKGCSLQEKNEDISNDDNQSISSTPSGSSNCASLSVTPSGSPSVSRKRRCTEQDVERRHREKMQLLRELHEKAIDNFNSQMAKLLEKL